MTSGGTNPPQSEGGRPSRNFQWMETLCRPYVMGQGLHHRERLIRGYLLAHIKGPGKLCKEDGRQANWDCLKNKEQLR